MEAVAQITIRDESDVVISSTAPSSPVPDMLWMDTSKVPHLLKRWDGSSWKECGTDLSDYYTKSQTNTKFEQTNQVIRSKADQTKVNELEKTVKQNKTLIEQTPEKIEAAVNAVQVGGTNIVIDSRRDISNNDYKLAYYSPTELFVPGETYAISASVEFAEGVTELALYVSQGWARVISLKNTGQSILKGTFTFTGYYSQQEYIPDTVNDPNALLSLYRFPNDGTVTTNSTIHWLKIEHGNKTTDWSPSPLDPVESVENASAVLTKDEFSIGFNGKNALTVNAKETRVDSDILTAPYIEGNVINTQAAASYSIGEGVSIQSTINNLKKYLLGDVSISISGYHTENIEVRGLCGNGSLYLDFMGGSILCGQIEIENCACPVYIRGAGMLERSLRGNGEYIVLARNASFIKLQNIGLQGKERSSYSTGCEGVWACPGSNVYIEKCLIEKCAACIDVSGGRVSIADCVGGNPDTSAAGVSNYYMGYMKPGTGGILTVANGKVPQSHNGVGYEDGALHMNANQTTPSPSPDVVPAVTVKTGVWQAQSGYYTYKPTNTNHGNMRYGWRAGSPRQGRVRKDDIWGYQPSYGYGLWIIGNANSIQSTITGKKVRSATVTIKRVSGIGTGYKGALCKLYYHGMASPPDDCRPSAQLFSTELTTAPADGEEVTYTLTADQITKLQNGTIKGFGLASWYDAISGYGGYSVMHFLSEKCTLTITYEDYS